MRPYGRPAGCSGAGAALAKNDQKIRVKTQTFDLDSRTLARVNHLL